MSGLNRNHMTGHWEAVNNKDIHSLKSCPYIRVSVMFKLKSTIRTGNKAHTERTKVYYAVSNRKVNKNKNWET